VGFAADGGPQPGGAREAPCYVRAAVPRRDAILREATATAAAVALALVAGCGSGARQDAGEHAASYPVTVLSATFPAHQSLAEPTQMRIAVRNDGSRTIPNIAATIEASGGGTAVEAFGRHSGEQNLASTSRPVWIVDTGPASGDSAYADTWAIGPLAPHAVKTFVWRLAAVQPGRYTLTYALSGSVTGVSKLHLADGTTPHGRFDVAISRKPGQVRVTPSGKIVVVRSG
jgi:hypothetical protein